MNNGIIEIVKELYESFLPDLQKVNWNELTQEYKQFLGGIPLSDYRESLQRIKTVEFDLSGKYKSFHLSLIYHFYWKNKFIVLIKDNVPPKFRKLKEIIDWLNKRNGKVPLYQILGQFNFDTEEHFIEWLFSKYSENIRPLGFIKLEQKPLSSNSNFLSFEDFWEEYKRNIDIDDFISQHQSFIDINLIKSQIISEIRRNPDIFKLLKEEDVRIEKTDELMKGYILVGLKARMYRTWVSLLTQLDLSYTWNKAIETSKMDSDVILDVKGIDVYGKINDSFIGFQIKKRSRRHEALRIVEGKTPIETIDIPYDLNFEKDEYLKDKLEKFSNGFVVFTENYARHIYQQIREIGSNVIQ